MFSTLTIEKIGYYVYCLLDPRDHSMFYIGKGIGNRVFSHANLEIEENNESEKLEIIREIKEEGLEVEHYIIRYGLSEKEAFEVEAALIDCLGIENLSNCVRGHETERGKISCEELDILLGAEEVEISDNVLIIRINKLYRSDMTMEEIYEATRISWVLSKKNVKNIDYVLSVCNGIIRGVFKPKSWFEVKVKNGKNRLGFEGCVAEDTIVNKYINKSIENYLVKGNSNPVMYVLNTNNAIYDTNKKIDICTNNLNQYIINEDESEEDNINEEIEVKEKSLFIKINEAYRNGMSKEELYNATRSAWRISKKNAEKVDYVFAIYNGEILEVYKVNNWYDVKECDDRIAFNGEIAEDDIRYKYIAKSVKHYYKKGEANPCKYINIKK